MDSVNKLLAITSRIDHLENSAEWITKESVHTDNTISQTGTLITVLADEIRQKVIALVQELEMQAKKAKEAEKYH